MAVARKLLPAVFGMFRSDQAYNGARIYPLPPNRTNNLHLRKNLHRLGDANFLTLTAKPYKRENPRAQTGMSVPPLRHD
jgi:hypothetical protein